MKIIQVLNFFLPSHVAGTEVYAYSLGRELKIRGNENIYLIPGYGKDLNEEYEFDGFRVIRYGEPSVVDRKLVMGRKEPDGLKNFMDVIRKENPDIVHFQELAGSNGITIHHIRAVKNAGFKIVTTLHSGKYTASYDFLELPTDIFNNKKGALNFLRHNGVSGTMPEIIYSLSDLLRKLKVDTRRCGKMGTAFYVSSLVEQKKTDFYSLIENSDGVVTIANWYRNLLIENGIPQKKLLFIEQGINYTSHALALDTQIQNSSTQIPLKFIFVGRISMFKGVKMLIEAVSGFTETQLLLNIYGESGENDGYIEECKMLAENKSNIRFKGRLAPDLVIEEMSRHDLLVLPSTVSEMSPLVIREAFASGIPVLASDNPGNAEQVDNGVNGWLFGMNDEDDLKSKLQMLIDHPDLITDARKHIPLIRTFDEVGKEYLELYRSLLPSSERSL